MVKFGDLLVSWVSYFNYNMVIILINVHHFHTIIHVESYVKRFWHINYIDSHMIIHVKSIFHINVQVESHEESYHV